MNAVALKARRAQLQHRFRNRLDGAPISIDFLALKDLIDNLLKHTTPHSPYISPDEWVERVGTAC